MMTLCEQHKFASSADCESTYEATNNGAIFTQLLALADVSGLDGQYICNKLHSTYCPMPYTRPATVNFPSAKPASAAAPVSSGNRIKVLHLSDYHLDPRYDAGNLYGIYNHDTPYYLGASLLQSIGPLTGTSKTGVGNSSLAFSIFTGDMVVHDSLPHLSRNLTTYSETSVFDQFKYFLSGPVFPVLGNHDCNPQGIDAPHSLGYLGQQQSWNYEHVAGLWQNDGWLTPEAANEARTHYAAYGINHAQYPKLKIIALNTDFWYVDNYLMYINTSNPDTSGMLAWLVTELQSAEDSAQRVWILGHVLAGWDGSQALPNPSDLFYQIVERYSPHVIAATFWGHTHEDQVMVYYANNGTQQTADNALATGWIGPSITPLSNYNSGYRLYEVDDQSFEVMDGWTFFADVGMFPRLDSETAGPVWRLEYSTRETYPVEGGWPEDAPLNATWWHKVTEAMEANRSLVEMFNTYQGKSSALSPQCVSEECAMAKVCYMRSGSVALGRGCAQGWAGVGTNPFPAEVGTGTGTGVRLGGPLVGGRERSGARRRWGGEGWGWGWGSWA